MAKNSQMRRATGRIVLGAALAMPLAWLLSAPAEAVPLQGNPGHTRTLTDASEAWYARGAVDICTTPLGCPPEQIPTSPYPADTLHVGVAGGQETARTYLLPNLLDLPIGATATSGTMTLPVDTAGTDGTVSADTATILACAATQPFTDGAAGSTAPAPQTDCKTSSPAKYDAKKSVFTVDLTPFLKAWASGTPSLGIALVPDPDKSAPTETWHVTINGRKLPGRPHVQSVITFTPAPPLDTSTGTGAVTPPAPQAPANPPAVSTPNVPPATSTPSEPAPVVAPSQPAPVAQPVAFAQKFQYPLAFLGPIALLIGAVFFVRLFTRDPLPRRVRS